MTPVVTAVLPTYNRAALLERAIESVLAQTWPHLRVLVCDNASPDATRETVEKIRARDPRVLYHRHPENRGAYFNFQFGVDAVESQYYAILSDDDVLLPPLFERAVEALEADPGAGFLASQVVLYDTRRGTHELRPSKRWREGRHEAGESARLMADYHFVWTGCVFRRRVRDTLGPFETIPMGDILFMAKAAARFPFVADLRPGAVFSVTGSNYSQTYAVGELQRSHEVVRRWAAALHGLPEEERRGLVETLDERLRVMAHGMLRDAAEAGDFPRFLDAAAYLESRGNLPPRRRARIAFARAGGEGSWRFRALGAFTRLHSGYKRRRTSGWRTRTFREIYEEYGGR